MNNAPAPTPGAPPSRALDPPAPPPVGAQPPPSGTGIALGPIPDAASPAGPAAGLALTALDAAAIGWCDAPAAEAAAPTPWLWDGYLAGGSLTLLTSQWKAGKTTLLALLLARLRTGGEFAGRALRAGKAVVVSEESESQWEQRRHKLGLGPHVCRICRPFRGKPTDGQWRGMVADLLRLWEAHRFDLLAIDTLGSFLPRGCENNADRVIDALGALRPLTDAGMAVFLTHHPPKGRTADGQAARGTGAFGGHCDILIEMKYYTRASDDDRRRRLFGYSRHEGTPAQLVLELNAAGTDYVVHGDFDQAEFAHHWQALRQVLEQAADRLTRRQIREQWPELSPPPDPRTLLRWLDRAIVRGLVQRRGTGRKNDPYRYWLPGREEVWQGDPAWREREARRRNREEIEREILGAMEAGYGARPAPAETREDG